MESPRVIIQINNGNVEIIHNPENILISIMNYDFSLEEYIDEDTGDLLEDKLSKENLMLDIHNRKYEELGNI